MYVFDEGKVGRPKTLGEARYTRGESKQSRRVVSCLSSGVGRYFYVPAMRVLWIVFHMRDANYAKMMVTKNGMEFESDSMIKME
jgi:hypothetical protein